LVNELRVGDQVYRPWQEAVERSVDAADLSLTDLMAAPVRVPIHCSDSRELEPLRDAANNDVGVVIRTQKAIDGTIMVGAKWVADGVYTLSVVIENVTALAIPGVPSRDDALPHSMISTHAIMGVSGGTFVSLLDPPAEMQPFVAGCQNVGTWPVLAGEEGDRSMMLSSPIILYDYPQIAPESAANLFDGTEIDEILMLRIMTLTDDEKREIQESDPRGRDVLARTEAIPPEQFRKMHGVIRTLRTIDEDEQ
jgi:hydrogenase maturation protease